MFIPMSQKCIHFLLRDAYMHKRGPCCRKMAGWLLQKVLDCRLLIKDRQQKGVSLNILPDPMNF